MPVYPDVAACTLAPDRGREVVSPSTARMSGGRKLRIHGREATAHLWPVDPLARMLEVHRLEAGRWLVAATHEGAEPVRAGPFEAGPLDLRRWWGEP